MDRPLTTLRATNSSRLMLVVVFSVAKLSVVAFPAAGFAIPVVAIGVAVIVTVIDGPQSAVVG